jgi:uncharacterized protein (DUF2235 family)
MPSPQNEEALPLLRRLFGRLWRRPDTDIRPVRGPQVHLVILDGTMSTLDPGRETNAGIAYRLARETGREVSIYYEPGLQWDSWRGLRDVMVGRGINRQIKRAYGYLASRYRVGDKIYLMGYSRGAYAVRSLAGIIDRVGLLSREHATERNITQAYRLYEQRVPCASADAFRAAYCRAQTTIEFVGVWDTVKSLGINAPVLWRLSAARHDFHNHDLSACVKRGCHALARDETRVVYRPVMWQSDPAHSDQIRQMWFRGSHGDVGGQLGGRDASRPLSNIPLVWMLNEAAEMGLPLPADWHGRFEQDASAPSIGTWAGWGKVFVTRRKRVIGTDPSERLHDSIAGSAAVADKPRPRRAGAWLPARIRRSS